MKRVLRILAPVILLPLISWNVLVFAAGKTGDPLEEFRSLKEILGQIDWKSDPPQTTGWDNITATEWPFFSLVYWGNAGCNLAKQDPAQKEALLRDVDWGIEHLLTNRILGFIAPHFGDPLAEDLKQPSALVHGHILYLLLQRRSVDQDPRYDPLIHRIAKSFSNAYAAAPSGILPSYPSLWWPTDNLPGLAGLRLYDRAFGTKLAASPCANWVASMRKYYTDPSSGLICAYINPAEKRPASGPRGVGVMFAFPFLIEVDPVFAREQFDVAKKVLVGEALGMTAVREFPEGQKGTADVDSGVLILGFGPGASGFGIAGAAAMQDSGLFHRLLKSKSLAVLIANGSGQAETLLPPVGRCVILFGETYPIP